MNGVYLDSVFVLALAPRVKTAKKMGVPIETVVKNPTVKGKINFISKRPMSMMAMATPNGKTVTCTP